MGNIIMNDKEKALFEKMKAVTRFEVIDESGRAYVKYLDKDEEIKYNLQDDKRTLKVFINKVNKEDV